MTFKRTFMFPWLAAALAPVILYAYLGQFSRLIQDDDYCQIALGQELGAWGYMVHMLDAWSGSYANWFFKGAIAPLDVLAARITPPLIIVLWLVGLSWLVFQALTYLNIDCSRRALSVTIAALAVTASIHAFHSPQSFYWYAASIHYTLPLALLAIYMALALWLVQQRRGDTPSLLGIIAGGLLCFISAGGAEVFVVFQLTFLAFCLLMSFALLRSSVRRAYALVFGVGWLATLGSLAIQLSAPGVARRAARIEQLIGPPNREMLLTRTLGWTLDYLGHPQVFLGFVMLMGLGLLVMLVKCKPKPMPKAPQPVQLAWPPLWLGLMIQLLWMPLLWLHTSGQPQLLGRFSIRYMAVIMLNILFILTLLLLLWQRKRIHAHLRKHDRGLLTVGYSLASMFIFAVLFAVTQLSVSSRLSIYLFISLLMFLVILTWQMSSLSQAARRFGWLALGSSGIGWISMTAIVFTALFGRGHVDLRILAPAAYLMTLSGLVWGVYMGWLLKHYSLPSSWMWLLKLGGLATVLAIGGGIALGQAALIPDFQLYAREWDARHQTIIAMRDSGSTVIEAAPLTWDLADYVDVMAIEHNPVDCAERYYSVDSIRAADT